MNSETMQVSGRSATGFSCRIESNRSIGGISGAYLRLFPLAHTGLQLQSMGGPPDQHLMRDFGNGAGGIYGQCRRFRFGWFQRGELAVDEACRHEMAGTRGDAPEGFLPREFQKHKSEARHCGPQRLAIKVFQCRAGEDYRHTARNDPRGFDAEARQPAGAIGIAEGDAGPHFRYIGRRMETIALDEMGSGKYSHRRAEAAFTATGNAHYHKGRNRLAHVLSPSIARLARDRATLFDIGQKLCFHRRSRGQLRDPEQIGRSFDAERHASGDGDEIA